MLRILPAIFILLLISGGLIFWRYMASKNNLATPNAQVVDTNLVEVPKTVPDSSLDEKVQILEDAITTLVFEINNLKRSISSLQSQGGSSFDDRLKAVEAAVTELKVKVSNLEKATPAPLAATSQSSTIYIPLGSGGSWGDQDWKTLTEYEISLDPGNYPGYKNMTLEVIFRLAESAGTGSVRLYNVTDNTVTSSELTTSSTTFNLVTSSTFTLPAGSKTYRLQVKSTQGKTLFIQSARIRVNF